MCAKSATASGILKSGRKKMLEFYEMTWGHIALNSVLIIVTYAWLIILTIFIMWRESKMGKRDFFITVFDPIIDIIFGLVGLVATHYYSTYIQAN